MSSRFKKRLSRLHASRQRLRQPEPGDEDGASRVFFADDVATSKRDSPKDLDASLENPDAWIEAGAKVLESTHGDAYYLHRSHPAHHGHGRWRLEQGRAVEIDGFCDTFPALFEQAQTRGLADIEPRQLGFVDLETNGLSKTSYPFCVGIGVWEGDLFSVYHFLMRAPQDEAAVLSASVALLDKTRALCTFNGASFDVPMLKRRCELHGVEHPFDTLPHLDLLRLSRKINTQRKSHKLSRLEEDLLNFERVDDVPGAQIPRLWNRYLKTKTPAPLLGVFEHNRLDILSMVVLLAEFSQAIDPQMAAAPAVHEPPAQKAGSRKGAAPSPSSMNQSLARAYALRKKSQTKRPGRASQNTSLRPTPSTPLKPAFSRTELNQGMPIGARLRVLRDEVEGLLARTPELASSPEARDTLLPRLHEILALAPRHPFALEKLVDYYRHTQQPGLRRHFEKRLNDISPF